MNEADSPLNQEFSQAADNPNDFDFGFVEQRRECGLANFNFPPDEAAVMRERELARIAAELENEPMDYEFYDDEDDDDIFDRDEFDYEDDEYEDEYDRYEESYGFDDEDEEEDDGWDN